MSDENLPVEQDPDITRLRRAYQIACVNIAELNDQRAALTDALATSMFLLDQLLTEMRLANVAPSGGLIVSKANFDRAMRKLLDHDPPADLRLERSQRRPIQPLRLASFARRSEWYWQLVRDHQIRNWGYVRKKKP